MKRALLVLLAACGDSATGDDVAPPDAPPVAPGTAVTVAVTQRGEPVANVQVMFQNPDGSVISVDVTDDRGTAGADIETGGFVTVIEPRAGVARDTLSTFSGVEVGDRLHLDLDEIGPTSTDDVDATITIEPGAPAYSIRTNCNSSPEDGGVTSPVHLQLVGCDDMIDALVIARDTDGELASSYFKSDVTLAPTTDLTGAQFDPFEQATVTYSDFGGFDFVGTYRAYATARGRIFDLNDGAFAGSPSISLNVPADAGSTMITSSTPFPAPDALGLQLIWDWQPATSTPYTLAVGSALLAKYTGPAVYDPASRTLMWTEGAGGEPDVARAQLDVFRDDIPTGRAWSWRIIAKRVGTRVVFPDLPVDRLGFDFNVADGDIATVPQLTTAKLPGGFDRAFRERGFADLSRLVVGASGRIVTQDLYSPTL